MVAEWAASLNWPDACYSADSLWFLLDRSHILWHRHSVDADRFRRGKSPSGRGQLPSRDKDCFPR